VASSGGSMSCSSRSQSTPQSSGSGIPGISELTASECYMLAASEVYVYTCSTLWGKGLDSVHGASSMSNVVTTLASLSAFCSSPSLTG